MTPKPRMLQKIQCAIRLGYTWSEKVSTLKLQFKARSKHDYLVTVGMTKYQFQLAISENGENWVVFWPWGHDGDPVTKLPPNYSAKMRANLQKKNCEQLQWGNPKPIGNFGQISGRRYEFPHLFPVGAIFFSSNPSLPGFFLEWDFLLSRCWEHLMIKYRLQPDLFVTHAAAWQWFCSE